MNQLKATDSGDNNVVDLAESPGRRLRVQRQSRGLEIERIATQMHLRRDVVEALEQDRYENLPAPVYVAGYLRNYARLLGLDPAQILAAYHAMLPPGEPGATPVEQAPRRPRAAVRSKLPGRLIALLLIGAVIGGAVFWWQGRDGLDAGPGSDILSTLFGGDQAAVDEPEASDGTALPDLEPAEPSPELDAVESPLPVESSAGDPPDAQPPRQLDSRQPTPPVVPLSPQIPERMPDRTSEPRGAPSQPQATAQVADDLEEPAPAASVAAPGPAPDKPAEVVLEFTGSSWVSVMGADGAVVLNREMRQGDRRVLEGQPPYQFVIGNAAATRMSVAGEPFDIVARSRGNVARFTLDPTNP